MRSLTISHDIVAITGEEDRYRERKRKRRDKGAIGKCAISVSSISRGASLQRTPRKINFEERWRFRLGGPRTVEEVFAIVVI